MQLIRTSASARSAQASDRWISIAAALLTLASTSALSARAWADESAQHPSAFGDTTRPVKLFDQVVVTGARYPRAYFESPQALSFLTRTRLFEQQPTVLGDALTGLPGVDNSKDSPWEERPVLRGLSGQRVLVLVDGFPMNSARGNGP